MTEQKAPSGPARLQETHLLREWKSDAPFLGVRCDPTGRYVVAAAQDHTLHRWNLEKDDHVSFSGHDSWARPIAFSTDGSQLLTAGYDGQLIWWDIAGELLEPVRRVIAHDGWVRAIASNPVGGTAATGGNDHAVRLWSIDSGELVWEGKKHESHVYSIAFHPSGDAIVSGDLFGVIHQWNTADGGHQREFDAKALHSYNGGQGVHYGGVRSIAFNYDGSEVAGSGLHKATNPLAGVNEPLIEVFDWEGGKKLRSLEANKIPRGVVWRLVGHPTNFYIGASGGSSGGHLVFWQGESTKDVHQLKLKNTLRDMDLHPNGLDVVVAHEDRHLRIYRMGPASEESS